MCNRGNDSCDDWLVCWQDGKSGRTVLHYAAETGNDALLEFILRQRKVNINSVTYGGLTPIALAAGRGYTNIVTTLKDAGADYSSLYQMDDDDSDDVSLIYTYIVFIYLQIFKVSQLLHNSFTFKKPKNKFELKHFFHNNLVSLFWTI